MPLQPSLLSLCLQLVVVLLHERRLGKGEEEQLVLWCLPV